MSMNSIRVSNKSMNRVVMCVQLLGPGKKEQESQCKAEKNKDDNPTIFLRLIII